MKWILLGLALFALLCLILSLLEKRYEWKEALAERYARCCGRHSLLRELTTDVLFFLRHPIDGVYYLKIGQRGSVTAASILYLTALLVYMVCRGLTSFVFGGGYSYYNDPFAILLIVIVPSVLFLAGSYLISSIHDGEGSFRAVYVAFGYCLSMFILCWPILTLLSHAFTLTEIFIYRPRLEAVSPKEAALMLAQEFSIPYEDREPPGRRKPKPRQETPEQRFCRMERYCFRVLSDYYHLLRRWKRDYAPKMPEEAWHPLFVEALQKQSHVEYLLDVLLSPDMEERAVLIVDYGKEVSNLERRMAELAAQDTAGRRTDHTRSSPAPEH